MTGRGGGADAGDGTDNRSLAERLSLAAARADGHVARRRTTCWRRATGCTRSGATGRRAWRLFSLGSDAHRAEELAHLDVAIGAAALAGIPAGRIVNTWPADRLVAWATRRGR